MDHKKRVMVCGGAGYIGSHAIKALAAAGYETLVYDNLSSGHAQAVTAGELVVADLADRETLDKTITRFAPDAVMHFAAFIQVNESTQKPFSYYKNNTCLTLGLLESMIAHDVRRFIFSSTAAVYGEPTTMPINEQTPLEPVNPYGSSKVMVERALTDLARLDAMNYVSLRYFNVAGADPDGAIGQRYSALIHLIARATRAAQGGLDEMVIFGDDYPTPDGSCIRDYIHVSDLVDAHLLALRYLLDGGKSDQFNLGYGKGYSVSEVVAATKRVTGLDFPVSIGPRRAGDPPTLVADSRKVKNLLGWSPRYDNLDFIIETAWKWELKLASESV